MDKRYPRIAEYKSSLGLNFIQDFFPFLHNPHDQYLPSQQQCHKSIIPYNNLADPMSIGPCWGINANEINSQMGRDLLIKSL